jgi:hypothetical protein
VSNDKRASSAARKAVPVQSLGNVREGAMVAITPFGVKEVRPPQVIDAAEVTLIPPFEKLERLPGETEEIEAWRRRQEGPIDVEPEGFPSEVDPPAIAAALESMPRNANAWAEREMARVLLGGDNEGGSE